MIPVPMDTIFTSPSTEVVNTHSNILSLLYFRLTRLHQHV